MFYELFLSYYNADNEMVGYDIFFNQPEKSPTDLHLMEVKAPSDSVVCVASLVEEGTENIVWIEVFLMGGYYG